MQEFEIELQSGTDEYEIEMEDKVVEVYPELEDLVVTPNNEDQVFGGEYGSGYKQVTVEGITGETEITENGTYDVTKYQFAKVNLDLSGFATHDEIPTKVSQLENDKKYVTSTELDDKGYLTSIPSTYLQKSTADSLYQPKGNYITSIPREYVTESELSTAISGKADKTAIPTKVSQLTNDTGYLTKVPDTYKTKTENDQLYQPKGSYLTRVPSEYITETELKNKGYATESYVTESLKDVDVDLTGYAKSEDIPTKTSELENDSGFLTEDDAVGSSVYYGTEAPIDEDYTIWVDPDEEATTTVDKITADVLLTLNPKFEDNLEEANNYTNNAIVRDIKDISYNAATATFVFTRHDNTTITVDLPIEATVAGGRYDDSTNELVLILVSGQEIRIPVSGLIDDYDGITSATIQCVVSADNKITCNIVAGSITKTLLTTELQNEITNKVNKSSFTYDEETQTLSITI